MPKQETYDVIILGTGSAGFSAVEGAISQGASVCVIEEDRLGGECPNFACVPSKALLKAAKVYRMVKEADVYGIELGEPAFDFAKIMRYRSDVVKTITGGGEHGDRYVKILKNMGVTIKFGRGVFVDEHTLEVNGQIMKAKAIVIATGTTDFIPPIKGLEQSGYWGWKEAIQTKEQPKSLAVIGGGPVGSELATFFASFGTRVTLLQSAPFVLHREDEAISARAQQAMETLGIDVRTNAMTTQVAKADGNGYELTIDQEDHEESVMVEQIIVATGKRSNVQSLGLEHAGVKLDARGSLQTTKEQRTNVKHIFGAGDVDGGMQFTHTAHHEGYIAGYNAGLLAQKKRKRPKKRDERVVPRVTFIHPEVASVGMTEKEVIDAHGKALIGNYEVAALGRAVTEHARFGLIKIVSHPKTRKVLGGHMIGDRAGEVVHEMALAIHLHATVDTLGSMIHAFPTYSEGIAAAAMSSKLAS